MLSGPTNDYFSDTHHLRGGFPTPNESSLRSGLTPGGSGSMFPAPSPNSQALFAQLASGGATPSTIDFHRTAMTAAAKRDQLNPPQRQPPQQPQAVTSQPQDMPNGTPAAHSESKPASGPFDPHDNDAANGLFMLAQGRNGAAQNPNQYPATSAAPGHAHPAPVAPQNSNTSPRVSNMNSNSIRDGSEGSNASDDSNPAAPQSRAKGKKNPPAVNGRRKAEEMSKAPAPKKAKANNGAPSSIPDDDFSDDDMDMKMEDGTRSKMTDEDKRKNFLERNRYVFTNPNCRLVFVYFSNII